MIAYHLKNVKRILRNLTLSFTKKVGLKKFIYMHLNNTEKHGIMYNMKTYSQLIQIEFCRNYKAARRPL